ncbi:MAG: prephenate dehydratase [Anaerolineales bacterium]|nr:prephenate dehydratase [Anaerolineales bacterium]
MPTVAFQGITGAYSESAIFQFFGAETKTVSCQTLEGIYEAVETGRADLGLLPVENALAGSLPRAYELLMERDLRIRAEVIMHIQHTLMAAPGVKLSDLKRVRSTQLSLNQCEKFINRYGLEQFPASDTASSARDLAAHPEPDLGVIASKLAAQIYKLDILEEEIEDAAFNYTRFFVLGREDPPRAQRSKTSLIFSARHLPGSLYHCLGEFAERNINLTKIESRPRRDRPWQYLFYLDFEGHWQDPAAEAALLGLLRRAGFVKMLGSYPMATTPHPEEAKGRGGEELWSSNLDEPSDLPTFKRG